MRELIVPKGVAPWIENPYGLVSLWEIMQTFNVADYGNHYSAIQAVASHVEELENAIALLALPPGTGPQPSAARVALSPVGVAQRQQVLDRLTELVSMLGKLHVPVTRTAINRLAEELIREGCTYGSIAPLARDVWGRLYDELSACLFLYVDPAGAALYEGKHPFGEPVSERFPSALLDIEEAGKCLALHRATACVFHLMRAMEVALRVLMTDMGEPYDPKVHTDWTVLLSKCNQHIGSAGAKQDFYRDAMTMLTSVKFSWRNPTMHLRNVYTEETALDVWNAVRIFIRHLATELSEPL